MMRAAHALKVLFLTSLASMATLSIVSACAESPTALSSEDAGSDGSPKAKDSATEGPDDDGGNQDLADAGKDAQPAPQHDGPGEAGAECAFNRDCQLALRCECDESTGCACQPGARGTGQNGIDACDGGNQCWSSLCVEGPDQGEFICSDECSGPSDCTGKLPLCIAVFGIPEPICARDPK